MSMEAYVSRAPRKPKSTRMDLNKALNIMGYNGWSELVPGNYFDIRDRMIINIKISIMH